MSGVTTSSLSLAWSLRNWVILDYEEANGQMKRPWAPFLLSFHLPLEDLPRNKDSLNMSDKAWQKGSRGGTETLLMTGRVFFFPVFLTTCHRQCFPNRTCQTQPQFIIKTVMLAAVFDTVLLGCAAVLDNLFFKKWKLMRAITTSRKLRQHEHAYASISYWKEHRGPTHNLQQLLATAWYDQHNKKWSQHPDRNMLWQVIPEEHEWKDLLPHRQVHPIICVLTCWQHQYDNISRTSTHVMEGTSRRGSDPRVIAFLKATTESLFSLLILL